ncbi:serine protease [Lentzea sp. NBRC 105346]|uniref:S8 family peptidase n=1 Tax=Lentzea sp. NBRC 105346 TaxID=3032205 RepID=UPI002557B35B|nr:S8 family serine peptidase [Lentzea sp. NBRC 105346]GLZ30295.1 serine protease [Lentzea sp. NBRC 105346]
MRSTALIAAAALVAGLFTGGIAHASPPPAGGQTVTLITGDRVTVTKAPGGKQTVRIEPGAGRASQVFFRQAKGDRLTVLPGDVAGRVRSGQLDRALFDVTGLIEQGYDDASRTDLPVIVSGGVHGASVTHELSSIGAVAARVPKGGFWAFGSSRVRLDRKVKASLDQSVPQIGAPAAWQAGYTGKGVKVAVIDTGYDRAHPDLKDVVVAEKDFTGEGVQDGNGHGTHVASTVAGQGVRYRGVAPDARLVIGKALDNDGSGTESDIIEAMEWAVESGARVVSMSLGSSSPSDGTDDMSLAVDNLSKKGVLFVIAAGNEGPGASIGAPGAASSALTVGSVSKKDVMSEFSSRGPRSGDYAVKPDVVAPGEDITAARAGGGYVAYSGTSMATPHVAGAAALLAQQHPQWTGAEIKNSLTSSAHSVTGSVYAQGNGRVDVARAVSQTVAASANASFSLVRWPHGSGKPETRSVTYTNSGDAAVSLSLSFSSDAPAGVLTLSADKVTVPARGTASVELRSNPGLLKVGKFSGRVVASAGSTVLQTTVGITAEAESYDITVKLIDRTGKPASDDREHSVDLLGSAGEGSIYVQGGQGTIRLPKGTYRLGAMITGAKDATLAGDPSLTLTKNTTVTLDARRGKKFTVRPARTSSMELYRSFGAVLGTVEGSTTALGVYVQDRSVQLYSAAASGGTADTFMTTYDAQLADGLDADLVARGPYYTLVKYWPGKIPAGANVVQRDADLARVHATFSSKNGKSGLVVRELVGFAPLQVFGSSAVTRVRQPGDRVEFYTAGRDLFWINSLYREPGQIGGNPPSPYGIVWATVFGYRAGSSVEPWNGAVEGPGLPSPASGMPGPDENLWVGHWGDTLDGRLPLFADTGQYQFTRPDPAVRGGWTVFRDGVEVASNSTYTGFSAPAVRGDAAYRIVGRATRSVPWSELSTEVSGTWTFRAAYAGGSSATRVPVLAVKFAPALDSYNRAPLAPRTLVPLRVERQGGTADLPVTELTVRASFDDGVTWVPAPVVRVGKGGYATVTNPPGVSGFVSLQVFAKDSGGNSVEEKVIRAYRLGT